MPVSLAQAKLNATDDVDTMVIDEFRKESAILDALVFDDVVNPAGGGSTLTYGYTRLITQPTADFRAINSEYTPSEVTKARETVEGQVVKHHRLEQAEWFAVDPGEVDEVKAVRPGDDGELPARGASVRMVLTPHLRHVVSVDVT